MKPVRRILIADDHAIVRDGLAALFKDLDTFEVVAQAGDGIEAIRMAGKTDPDLILIDLSMPKMNGLEAIRELKRQNPSTRVLVMTGYATEEYVFSALNSGADGYFLKEGSREELLQAVSNVLDGKRYICPGVSEQVIEGYLHGRSVLKPKTAWDTLTPRELEILKLVAEGYKNREIAEALFISIKTVEKHRANLMAKLRLGGVAELAKLAVEKGLIEKSPRL
ncbi:MAG: response regulator transcription factor [Desulfobacterales bacterium]|jgi:DNA-binding NarL/FixJ family response regulator